MERRKGQRRAWFRRRRYSWYFQKNSTGWKCGTPTGDCVFAVIYNTYRVVPHDGLMSILDEALFTKEMANVFPVFLLMTVYVPEGQRRRGIASHIVKAALGIARHHNVPLAIGPIENPLMVTIAKRQGIQHRAMPFSLMSTSHFAISK